MAERCRNAVFAGAQKRAPEREVFGDRQVRLDAVEMSDVVTVFRYFALGIAALKPDGSTSQRKNSCGGAQECRLAGAVRSGQQQGFATADGK